MLRIINIGLVLAFSLCYMEWGQGNSSFIFQTEYTLFTESEKLLSSITHPLILAGLIGQILLLISAIRKTPNRIVNMAGILILSPVVLLVLLAGSLSLNVKMIISALPFVVLGVIYFLKYRRK